MFRGVFSGALRDSSAPSAAAAKCSLVTSGLVRSSSSWALSLANVKQPNPEALYACAVSICPFLGNVLNFTKYIQGIISVLLQDLLTTDHWDTSEVLGLAAMAGHAICKGE